MIGFNNSTPSPLTSLDVSDNSFTGSIGSDISQLSGLAYFYLMHNMITGPIPSSLAALSQMKCLVMHNNVLTGTIHDFNNQSLLQYFDVYSNSLTGTVYYGDTITFFVGHYAMHIFDIY